MRILQVHTRYRERGGEDVVVDREAELLAVDGHEVIRYILTNPANPLRAATALAASPWNSRQSRRLATAIADVSPDLAHVHNTWFSLSPSVFHALDRAAVPTVLTLHNYRLICSNGILYRDGRICEDCIGGNPWQAVQHRCYRDSVPQSIAAAGTIALNRRLGTWTDDVDAFVALTDVARGKFVEGGIPDERIITIPNSVPDPGPRLLPPEESNTVLFVGRLSEEKGIDLLLDAWTGSADLSLTVAGDGPLRRVLAHQYPNVSFVGKVAPQRIAELMLSSRSLVFPSRWYEGLPLVVLEAMASGLPVMTSSHGGAAEATHPLGAKWRINGGSTAWIDGLQTLTDDAAVRTAGNLARETYLRVFDARNATSQLESVYERAQNHRSRRT